MKSTTNGVKSELGDHLLSIQIRKIFSLLLIGKNIFLQLEENEFMRQVFFKIFKPTKHEKIEKYFRKTQ